MNPLSNILAHAQQLLHPTGVRHLDPSRDWLLVLAVAFVLFVGSVAWNAWFFFIALNEQSAMGNTPSAEVVDTSALEKAREVFDARALEEERYRSEYRFVDPSH